METEQVRVTFQDDDSAAQIASKLVDALDAAFSRATRQLGDRLEKPFRDMASASAKSSRSVRDDFADIEREVRRATRSADAFATTMTGISRTAARSGGILDPSVFDATGRSFNRLDENIERIIRNFDRLSNTAGGRQVLGDLTSAIRSQANQANVAQQSITRVAETEARARADAARVSQQRITALEVAASKERIVAAQQEGSQTLQANRAAAQRRIEIFRAGVNQIRALERGLGSVFQGTARALGASLSGVGNVFGNLTSRARASTRDINASLSGTNTVLDRRTSVFRSAFSRQESILRSSVTNQITQVERLDRALSGGVLGAASGRSATAGALGFGGALAGGAGLTSLLTQGFTRFSEIERLNKQFLALTGNAAAAEALMAQIKEFAKTTSFDLTGVADLAKGFLAMGTATEDVLPRVRTIADAVALTGGGVDELNRIQRAIGQVVSAGRLQGDELNQLAENLPGLNIRKILSEQLGVTVPELVKMQEEGKISADMFLEGLLSGLAADTRLTGAAQDLAQTLSGRFANLKESFADLGASLIGLVSNQLRATFLFLNNAFAGLTNFIRGEGLSKGLETLRTGLGGVAQALALFAAGLLALQGLRVIGVLLAGLATPMGLLVAAVAAAGFVFKTFEGPGKAFALVLDTIQASFRAMVNAFIDNDPDQTTSGIPGFFEKVGTKARIAFNYIGDVVIPKLREIAALVGGFVLDRLRDFANFFTETLVPAVRTAVTRGFDLLRTGVQNFWRIAQPILEPAVALFGRLKDALFGLVEANPQRFFTTLGASVAGGLAGFAVGGPLGALVGGIGGGLGVLFAQGFGDEIIAGLQGVGRLVVDGLQAGLRSAGGVLSRVFSIDNLLDAGLFATELAQRLGKAIGTALSDPRVVAGAAAVAGIAALAAARFVIGFGQGVISNIPELAELLREALESAFSAAVNAIFGTSLDIELDWLVNVLLPAGAVALVVAAFRKIGGLVNKSITEGLQGPGVQGSSLTNGPRSLLAGFFGGPGGLERAAADAARSASRAFRTEFDRNNRIIQSTGGERVASTGNRSSDIRNQATALSALNDQFGRSQVQGNFARDAVSRFGSALRLLDLRSATTALRDLGTVFQNNGRAIGVAAGTAIGAGVAAGFSAQLATSGGVGNLVTGLLGVVGSIGTAFAVGGAPLAALAAGIGATTFAFNQVQKSAEKAKNEVMEYVAALRDASGAQVGLNATEVVLSNLADQSDEVRANLLKLNFNATGFADRISSGASTAERELARLALGAGATAEQIATITPKEVYDRLTALGITSGETARLLGFLGDESGELQKALDKIALGKLEREASGLDRAADSAARSLRFANDAASAFEQRDATRAANEVQRVATEAALTTTALELAARAADEFLNGDYTNSLQSALDDVTLSIPSLQSNIDQIATATGEALNAARRQIDEAVQGDLRAVVKADLIADIQAGEVPDPRDALRDLASRLGAEIEANPTAADVPAKFTVIANINSLLTDPNLPNDIAALVATITGEIPESVVSPPVTVSPRFTLSADAAERLASTVSSAGNLGRSFGGGSGGRFQGLRSGASTSGSTIDVPITVNPKFTVETAGAALVGAQLATAVSAGFRAAGARLTAVAATVARLAISGMAGVAASAFTAGRNIALGLASGVRAGTEAAVSAARSMAQQVANAAKNILKISSPSRVFVGIGLEIGRGLAQGIADSEDGISGVLDDVMRRVTDRAVSQAEQVAAASARVFDLLQPQGQNGQTNVGAITQLAGLSRIAVDLQSVFDDAAATLFTAVARNNEGSADATQRSIAAQFNFGIGPGSLNRNTTLGSQNVEAFLSVTERIRDFIRDSVASGADVGGVIGQAQRYIDQVREVGAQYRVSSQDLEELLAAQGLSAEALARFRNEVLALQQATGAGATPTPKEVEADERETQAERDREEANRQREEADRALMLELLRVAVTRPTSIELSLPYGDPEAVALATLNKIASDLSV